MEVAMSLSATAVNVPDKNLNRALHVALDVPLDSPLTDDDLSKLAVLNASAQGITDLTGLEYCINLVKADLSSNLIQTLEPLKSLVKLAWLSLASCCEQPDTLDLAPIESLTALRYLDVRTNQLVSIDPVPQFTRLESLFLDGNELSPGEMNKLALPALIYLNAADGIFTDLSFVSGMPKLQHLGISYCYHVSDISPLTILPHLRELNIGYMASLRDYSPLGKLTSLRSLNIQNCFAVDRSVISGMTGLEVLNINEIKAYRLDFVSGLVNLRELYFQQDHIRDLSPLKNLLKLTTIGAVGNEISDLSPLAGLTSLSDLDIEANAITSLAGLENCPLQSLNVSNNYLTDQSEIDQIMTKVPSTFYSGNFLLDLPMQHAVQAIGPVSVKAGRAAPANFQVVLTTDGKTYAPSQVQVNSIAFRYAHAECADKSVARAVSWPIDVADWVTPYRINGLSAGDTSISVHYLPNESTDVVLPFTDGTTSVPVHVA
jgi:Leucine-rich repeat (LRR) protein